jgi:ligand-binding SRPBCC domain-containing protein
MVSGAFKSFRHEHHFEESGKGTLMKDIFIFESPLGILGTIANHLLLTKYMIYFLNERNMVIKEFAESEKGKKLLTQL